jgi:hypothetical protein
MSRLKAGSRAEGFKSHRGRSEKKLEKPLDKSHKVWYNKSVPKGNTIKQKGTKPTYERIGIYYG